MSDAAPMAGCAAAPGDEALIRGMAAGDQAAFELLMRRHNRRLFRLARATLREDAEAQDALQEAYLAAWRASGGFRGEAAPATWLCRLLLNECLGRIRRRERRHRVAPMQHTSHSEFAAMADNDSAPEPTAMRAELRALLERELDALPAVFRQVFVLRCVEEMTVEETASCLGIPEATVRSRLFRARGMLRDAMARRIDLARHDLYEFGGAHCDRLVNRVFQRLEEGA